MQRLQRYINDEKAMKVAESLRKGTCLHDDCIKVAFTVIILIVNYSYFDVRIPL